MIALLVTFLTAIFILFAGIQKQESQFKNITFVLLLFGASLALIESQGIINFEPFFGKILKGYMKNEPMLEFGLFRLMAVSIITFIAAFIIALMPATNRKGSDILALMLFSLCGAQMMIGSNHLVMLFLGIEILSIPLYVLSGSDKENLFSNESAIKYFIMGSFSTAILLLGSAFIYGGTGTFYFSDINVKLSFAAHFGEFPILIKLGLVLTLVGLLFKISAVPFHFWSPDVYEGAPNRVASFMAIIVKIAGFIALAQFIQNFYWMQGWYNQFLIPVSMITILLGNIVALVQKSVKRTLAYSSISHAGYLLMFVIAPFGTANMWIIGTYALAYGLGTSLLFYFMDKYSSESTSPEYSKGFDIFNGMFYKNKWEAVIFTVAILSVAGIPSTVGFVAKFHLFRHAIEGSVSLTIIALIGSAISIAYYFKPFKNIYSNEFSNHTAASNTINWIAVFMSIVIIALGFAPMFLTHGLLQ